MITPCRCHCDEKIILKYMGFQGYVVLSFAEDSKEGRKFLKCNRKLSLGYKSFMVDARRVNIGSTRFFKEFYGSYKNVGATSTEFKHFVRAIKLVSVRMKEGHLTGRFWDDAIRRRNYSLFGDALSFDATYRTNTYHVNFPFLYTIFLLYFHVKFTFLISNHKHSLLNVCPTSSRTLWFSFLLLGWIITGTMSLLHCFT